MTSKRNRGVLLIAIVIIIAAISLRLRHESKEPDQVSDGNTKNGDAEQSADGIIRIPYSETPKLLERFVGDPKLVEDFLESEGRSAANLIAAFTLLKEPLGWKYLEDAYAKYPGDPLVVGYAIYFDGIEPDIDKSASLMIKERPDDASGYLLGAVAGIKRGENVETLLEKYLNPVARSHMESADYLLDIAQSRYTYARKYELMTEERSAKVAIASGGFVVSPIIEAVRTKALEFGNAAIGTDSVELAQNWYLIGLIAIQSENQSPFIARSELISIYEQDLVNRLTDESLKTYFNTTREELMNDIDADTASFKDYQRQLDSVVRNLTVPQYREYIGVLLSGGEHAALEWTRELNDRELIAH